MMRSGNIFEREGSRGHGCDGDGTEITGGGDYSGWDKMYDQGSIEIKGRCHLKKNSTIVHLGLAAAAVD